MIAAGQRALSTRFDNRRSDRIESTESRCHGNRHPSQIIGHGV
jgi:hypothetical protein